MTQSMQSFHSLMRGKWYAEVDLPPNIISLLNFENSSFITNQKSLIVEQTM